MQRSESEKIKAGKILINFTFVYNDHFLLQIKSSAVGVQTYSHVTLDERHFVTRSPQTQMSEIVRLP